MKCLAANSLWLASCLPEYVRFRRALRQVDAVQEAVLLGCVSRNRDTEFGRFHDFASIRSVQDYRDRVPLREPDDFQEWLDRIADGTPGVLTEERVRLLEPTSGSTRGSRLIPYTASLQAEFQRAIQAWVTAMFLDDPRLMDGCAYWSVSPAIRQGGCSRGGIPIGFDADSAYLGGFGRRLVDTVLAVPGKVRFENDFQKATADFLRGRPDLRLISAWSPSFLELLLDRMPDVHWPQLRVVSCWADGHSAEGAQRVAARLPQARVVPKGLVATEGVLSIPVPDAVSPVLAIRSHFIEFVSPDRVLGAGELELGGRYAVVLTTGGGLYRYKLNDLVEVTGFYRGCPCIRFIGRAGHVSDRFGEKLSEAQAAAALRGPASAFSMLAFEEDSYVWFVESNESDDVLRDWAARIEARLRENFHFDYCRRLGQLGPIRYVRVSGGSAAYQSYCVEQGQRAGDVKAMALDLRSGWSERFRQSVSSA